MEPSTRIKSAYLCLRQDIIECRLVPSEKLRVEHLKDRYHVGAGTLREAMSLLVADGLVTSQAHQGFRVAPISLEDFKDITETRLRIECEALSQAIDSGDDNWEASLLSAFHRLHRSEERMENSNQRFVWEVHNQTFHETLISACPSHWLKHFFSILYRQAIRYRHIALRQTRIPRDVHEEHSELVEAVLSRDKTRALMLLGKHIQFTFNTLLALPPELLGKELPSRPLLLIDPNNYSE